MTTSITNLSDRFSGTVPTKQTSETPSPQSTVRKDSVVVQQQQSVKAAQETKKNNGLEPSNKAEINPNNKADVQAVLEKLNLAVEKIQTGLNFSVDENRGGFVIKVVDQTNDKTIRQIPSEEMLRIYHRLQEVNSLLFDDIEV